jgi:serine/threonine protein kinase
MLSGKRAFHGDSAADTMSAILSKEPPDPSETDRAIAPGLERVVRHCLEKNPEERFHSAHDLAFDLQALSGESSVASRPGAVVSRVPSRRSVSLVWVGAALPGRPGRGGLAGARLLRRSARSPRPSSV